MSRFILLPTFGNVVQPDNVDFYLQVNPSAIEVKKIRGGWKPIDKKRWCGNLPIKAKLIERKA